MEYNYKLLIDEKYRRMCDSIFVAMDEAYFDRISSLHVAGVLRDDAFSILNHELKKNVGVELATEQMLDGLDLAPNLVFNLGDDRTILLVYAKEWVDKAKAARLLLEHGVNEIRLVLPHMRPRYKRPQRYLIDKILTDGQLRKCTDVHIEPVSDFNGHFEYLVKYRQGLFLEEITDQYKLDNETVDEIIYDMISKRSRSTFKAGKTLTATEVKFSLIDPLYPTRCEVARTIGGSLLVIRFFDFENPFRIETLGFPEDVQSDLRSMGEVTSGLSLVSGVIGSGKGTTINAIALDIVVKGKYSLISIDSPTEYLGRFPQVEYQSGQHLYEICNAVKKLDKNFVLLNEIATRETAEQVYNLVVSGVHVLTTIHSNRVYRVVYKLREMLGDLYTSIIPYMNLLSYQDKFSITCPDCQDKLYIDHFVADKNKYKLLEFLGLDTISQPRGCSKCNDTGILKTGIQVVSEHLIFNSRIRDELLRRNIHEQAAFLQEEIKLSTNLESVLKTKLELGEVLIEQVVAKLDTWR